MYSVFGHLAFGTGSGWMDDGSELLLQSMNLGIRYIEEVVAYSPLVNVKWVSDLC